MMTSSDESVEQTLHVGREVHIYRVPPQTGSGHRSGDWKVADRLFTGRLRVIARGEACEVRIEDVSSGELFACCPVPSGMRTVCIVPCMDSSRYFVLRVEDPNTKRHAFLGLGFEVRSESFDFNEALISHEKWVARQQAAAKLHAGEASSSPSRSGGIGSAGALSEIEREVQSLYSHQGDMALKDGQTIRVNLRKTEGKPASAATATKPLSLLALAPPPDTRAPQSSGHFSAFRSTPAVAAATSSLLPTFAPSQSSPAHTPSAAAGDLLGFDATDGLQQLNLGGLAPTSSAANQAAVPVPASIVAVTQDSWASFD